MKKVSILIPVYNSEPYLKKCLESVLRQTYTNLQIVLIDDGSKDNSWNVINNYINKDSRIEAYHQDNQGVSKTRNNLIEKIKGDYVLFVDSDDWIELDMIKYLVMLAQTHHSKFVMCDRVINDMPVQNNETKVIELNQLQAIKDFLQHDYFVGSLCNKLLDSSLLHNVSFHCGISYGEDALFCWEILKNVENVICTTKQLYHYRMNNTSISHLPFDEKKMSGHKVWEIILNDVINEYPEYIELAKGTFAFNDLYLLQAASQSNYLYDSNIFKLQNNVKKNFKFLCKRIHRKYKLILYSYFICRYYIFGKIYYLISNFKRNIND